MKRILEDDIDESMFYDPLEWETARKRTYAGWNREIDDQNLRNDLGIPAAEGAPPNTPNASLVDLNMSGISHSLSRSQSFVPIIPNMSGDDSLNTTLMDQNMQLPSWQVQYKIPAYSKKYWNKRFRKYRRYTKGKNAKFYKAVQAAILRNKQYEAKKAYRSALRAQYQGGASNIAAFGRSWKEATNEQKRNRAMFRYYGPGDYWSDFKKGGWFGANAGMGSALRGLGGAVGSYLGAGGSALGTAAGGAVSKWLGFGDYSTPSTTNQLMGGGSGPDAQMNISVNPINNTGDVYLSHTEFIGNVTATASAAGSSSFDQKVIELNPGLFTTFPWLSQLASNFELYDWQGLVFQYKPTSGESATTTNSLGKVIIATQYDNDANPFLNSVEMQNYDYANSTKPSCGLIHGVETAQQQQAVNMMYVRTGKTTRDKTFTDIGKLVIATEGIPFAAAGTQIIGELWVSYRIKLSRATLYNALMGLSTPYDSMNVYSSAATIASSVVTSAKSTGYWTVSAGTTVRRNLKFTANSSLIAGCYLISTYLSETGGVLAVNTSTPINATNCELVKTNLGASWSLAAYKVAAETSSSATFAVSINNTNNTSASIELPYNADIPAGAKFVVLITQISCNSMNDILG